MLQFRLDDVRAVLPAAVQWFREKGYSERALYIDPHTRQGDVVTWVKHLLPPEKMEPLSAAVDNIPRLPSRLLLTMPNAGQVETWLVLRSLTVGEEQAVTEFETYLNSDTVDYRQIILIGGIEVPHPLELEPGVTLERFRPDYYSGRWLPGGTPYDFRTTPEDSPFKRVTAAIIRKFKYPKFYEFPEDGGPAISTYDATIHDRLHDFAELELAALLLTLMGPSGPAVIASFAQHEDWVPFMRPGVGTPPRHHDMSRGTFVFEPSHQTEFKRLYDAFFTLHRGRNRPGLTKEEKRIPDRLLMALRRLNHAIRRPEKTDAAIDLGVALEVLFVDQKPADGSISFTLRVRATRFLATSYQERLSVATLLSQLYSLRSDAAHTGAVEEKKGAVSTSTILVKGKDIVATALRKLIIKGFPDWDSVLFDDNFGHR